MENLTAKYFPVVTKLTTPDVKVCSCGYCERRRAARTRTLCRHHLQVLEAQPRSECYE